MSAQRPKHRGPSRRHVPAATAAPEGRLAPDVKVLKVALLFFLIYAAMQMALWALVIRGHFTPVQEWMATVTGACSIATGVPAAVFGTDVALQSRILRIDADCTGVTLMMVYSALVLAYPLGWKKKVIGLALGIPAIFLANVVRLVAVAQLAGLEDGTFLFVHDYLFKIVMMAVVIAAWAVYLARARRHAAKA